MEEQTGQQKFAVLIDGDNAQASLLSQIFAEVSKFGLITIKRIYGDWTSSKMNQWKDSLPKQAVQPIQQFMYTVGKNATDSAMIIDAMDLLHNNDLDGFCIVSSDSDYTRLATRIREEGLFVIGVGEKKTPESFRNACNQFIYCENLVMVEKPRRRPARRKKIDEPEPVEKDEKDTSLMKMLIQGFEMAAKEEEWVSLAAMGNALHQLDPAFDPRTYGHKRLLSLLKDYTETFTIKQDRTKKPPVANVSLKTGS